MPHDARGAPTIGLPHRADDFPPFPADDFASFRAGGAAGGGGGGWGGAAAWGGAGPGGARAPGDGMLIGARSLCCNEFD